MFIQIQETPNPSTVKFLPGITVLEGNKTLDFTHKDDAYISPLAQRLFAIEGIVRVFLGNNFVSVGKANEAHWETLKPVILTELMEHFSTGMAVIIDIQDPKDAREGRKDKGNDPLTSEIIELLEERVRPMVAMDGGDIVFERFEDGVVYLHMRGACAGCPSASMTLKSGIESMLRHYIPEVIEVRSADEL
ncbi:MAG: NifU family protein [Alphaproteobacteria bacterium]